MSIKKSEALDAYKQLSQIISSAGLSWLVSDVERQIALGKPVKKKIEIPDSESPPDSHLPSKQEHESKPKKTKRKVSVMVAEEYSAIERLKLLVDAVEAVTPGLSMAVIEIMSFIESKLKNFSALEFSPDREDVEPGKAETSKLEKDFQNKKQKIVHLSALLGKVKEAIQ